MCEQENRFGYVIDMRRYEARMVFGEMDDGVLTGDIGRSDNGELFPWNGWVEGDGCDAPARNRAADRGSKPHAWQFDVVNVLGAAQNFRRALFA